MNFSCIPRHGSTKVPCKMLPAVAGTSVQGPASGLYGTSGPGTVKRIKDFNKVADLRFDTNALNQARLNHASGQR